LTVYKFNGAQYSNVACYDANSGVVDEHGEVHQFKEPRLTPCQ
jgi:hypothetical protein